MRMLLKKKKEVLLFKPWKRINLLLNSKIYSVVNLLHISYVALPSFLPPSILFLPSFLLSFLSHFFQMGKKNIHITPNMDKTWVLSSKD